MINSSLIYEILLYLNSFYFGMFATCELGMGVLKAVNLKYDGDTLLQEAILLLALITLESVRIYFGRHGSLSDHGWRVVCSVFLILPCAAGVTYLLIFQEYKLRLEYILCALMLALQVTEMFYAILFVVTRCRPVSYA